VLILERHPVFIDWQGYEAKQERKARRLVSPLQITKLQHGRDYMRRWRFEAHITQAGMPRRWP
jgi:hypothetical protein